MNIISLAELFSEVLNHQVYAINFPEYTDGSFIKIEINSGVEELGGVYDFNVQFMVKAEHPSESERVASEIITTVDMLTNKDFAGGTYQLILAKAGSPQPYFVGETENKEFIFSVEFRILTSRI